MTTNTKTTTPEPPEPAVDSPEAGAETVPAAGAQAGATAPAEPLTPAQIAELQAQAAKADDHWGRLVRLAADFENFKKRAARERDDARKSSTEAAVSRLLPVLDNFDMALAAAGQPGANVDTLRTGVNMILTQLRAALTDLGVEEVDATGQAFNPQFHEAISQQDSADVPEGQVLQQVRKGYRLRERLLRPASVVVARKPAASA